MGCWGFASSLLVMWTSVVAAQPADVVADTGKPTDPAPDLALGYGAMPGGLRAPSAETLPAKMFGVSLIGGFGVRNTLLSADHKMSRGIGDVAFAFAPTDLITLGLAFDGRFDKHSGLDPKGDDGYVGDPRLIVRLGKRSGKITVGGQLAVLVPGKDAPSVATSAISVDGRGLLTLAAGPGKLSLNAGFRLDNSAKSVVDDHGDDDRLMLSAEDRVSLGVSDFNAIVAGAHYQLPAGAKGYIGFETSLDLFFGKYDGRTGQVGLADIPGTDAPGPILRIGANGGYHVNPQWTLYAFVQLAKVPGLSYGDVAAGNILLIPYEPVFTGGLALAAHFGKAVTGGTGGGKITKNKIPDAITVIEYAEVSGLVTDDSGKPVAGAKVTVKLKNNTGTATTDEKGEYLVSKLPIGKTIDGKTALDDLGAEVTIDVGGKKPKVTTLTLVKGPNKVATFTLDPVLPPGQFKAVVRAAGTGKPLQGITVKLVPGGATATTDDQGNVSFDVQPGTYKATASGAGFQSQELEVVVEQSAVVVKQFELRR